MTMETFIGRIRTHVLVTIFEGLFHSPQTLNGHVKKGTGSLIQHPGATTVKWSQIGAALTFLSNTPSLLGGEGCDLYFWATVAYTYCWPKVLNSARRLTGWGLEW